MACLNIIVGNESLVCGVPPAGPLGRPVSAKIINASDIESYTIGGTPAVATITRVAGTPAATSVETSNGALVVTMGLKGGETYPQALNPTFEMTFFVSTAASIPQGVSFLAGMNSRVVIAVDHGNGVYRVYGLGYPLECLSIEGDTNGNGYVRTTFGVEEWQTGTTVYRMSEAEYVALSTAVPAAGGEVTPPSGGDSTLDENPLG